MQPCRRCQQGRHARALPIRYGIALCHQLFIDCQHGIARYLQLLAQAAGGRQATAGRQLATEDGTLEARQQLLLARGRTGPYIERGRQQGKWHGKRVFVAPSNHRPVALLMMPRKRYRASSPLP